MRNAEGERESEGRSFSFVNETVLNLVHFWFEKKAVCNLSRILANK